MLEGKAQAQRNLMHTQGIGLQVVGAVARFAVAGEEVTVAEVGGNIGREEVGAAEAHLSGQVHIGMGRTVVIAADVHVAARVGEHKAQARAHIGS